MLSGIELKFDMPEHIFAAQPVLAEIELRNDKQAWPSFSLLVVGQTKRRKTPAEILTRPVFFPYIPRRERVAPESGAALSAARRLPAGRLRHPHALSFRLLRENARGESDIEMVVYPRVEPTEQFYEILPLLSGEMASHFRGRGHELHSLREYLPTDSARFVDWKVSAKLGRMAVREFAREDERRVMIVLDPFIGPPRERPRRDGYRRASRTIRAGRVDGGVHRLALSRNSLGDPIPYGSFCHACRARRRDYLRHAARSSR